MQDTRRHDRRAVASKRPRDAAACRYCVSNPPRSGEAAERGGRQRWGCRSAVPSLGVLSVQLFLPPLKPFSDGISLQETWV